MPRLSRTFLIILAPLMLLAVLLSVSPGSTSLLGPFVALPLGTLL